MLEVLIFFLDGWHSLCPGVVYQPPLKPDIPHHRLGVPQEPSLDYSLPACLPHPLVGRHGENIGRSACSTPFSTTFSTSCSPAFLCAGTILTAGAFLAFRTLPVGSPEALPIALPVDLPVVF